MKTKIWIRKRISQLKKEQKELKSIEDNSEWCYLEGRISQLREVLGEVALPIKILED